MSGMIRAGLVQTNGSALAGVLLDEAADRVVQPGDGGEDAALQALAGPDRRMMRLAWLSPNALETLVITCGPHARRTACSIDPRGIILPAEWRSVAP
ncbi:hypothetical protein [Marinimicrococcus flavescens]|uniref:Uncharacterized protein n=1 Tax=Marinimicrococcus flavescens TaxID=3031815 RepID=A0AAP3V2T4_9PROT|nr:hypothetical protein [Marinimicrococcus flavescens]